MLGQRPSWSFAATAVVIALASMADSNRSRADFLNDFQQRQLPRIPVQPKPITVEPNRETNFPFAGTADDGVVLYKGIARARSSDWWSQNVAPLGREFDKTKNNIGRAVEKAGQDVGKTKITVGIGSESGGAGSGLRGDDPTIEDNGNFGRRPIVIPPPRSEGSTIESAKPPLFGPSCGMDCPSIIDLNPAVDLPEKPIEAPGPAPGPGVF
jgi:hypothetical protein